MKVTLLRYTEEPDKTAAMAARACYSDSIPDDIPNEAVDRLLPQIIRSGHLSVLEHVVFTFGVSNVSRVLTHQLVRHRIASYSQQSHRYVSISPDQFVVPPSVDSNPEALSMFNDVLKHSIEVYNRLIEMGITREDARFVIPQAVSSNIVVTMNARELLHFFTLRTCIRAQWEIRELALEMLRLCKKKAPVIFGNAGPSCVRGRCPERKPCDDIPSIREFFSKL